jgi:hypothetical protein
MARWRGCAGDEAAAPASKWQAAIDARWGPGLPIERKLEIFDTFWRTIDERLAAFQDLDGAAAQDDGSALI